MGFYGPARCGYHRLDRHLITALVERWRPETHPFHFPIGEVPITLQDVAVIWGLPIEGEPVVCREPHRTKIEWRAYCHQWLGFSPHESEMRTSQADKTTIAGALSLLQFIWEPYDFTSPDIVGLGPSCLTVN
ncbi:hypothetical protein ACS0TY_013042 [Phlomoides rotata]